MAANDPEFTIIEENDAHTEVAMVERENAIGKPFFEVFPDTSDYFKKHGVSEITLSFRNVIESKKPDTMTALKYDIKDADGVYQERWWQATHYPMFDSNGTVTAIFQQTQDITEQMISDSALAQTKYQLEEALAVGQIGTWSWDIERDVVIADKNLARMFGVDESDALKGLNLPVFTDSIYIDDRPEVLKQINLAIEQDTPYEIEYRTVSRDGTIRWVIARGRVTKNDSGTPLSFAGILVDISERKIAETNLAFLADASALLSTSLDYSQTLRKISKMIVPEIADWCSIDILDDDGQLDNIVLSHKDENEARSLKNYRAEHVLPLANIASGIGKVMTSGEPVYYPDMVETMDTDTSWSREMKRKIATMNMTSAIITPLIVRQKVVGAITFATTGLKRPFSPADFAMLVDLTRRASLAMTNAEYITESRRQISELELLKTKLQAGNDALEARVKKRTTQLEITNLSLERSNRELQDFAYVASHDLQEPLRKIQAFGTILEEEYASELGDGGDYLSRMRSAAARMSTLIEDLLAFSRVTTHAKELKEINLNDLVDDVTEDLSTRIDDTKGAVEVGDLPTIRADPVQMRQLFQNLIGNALKFHRPDTPPVIQVAAHVTTKNNKPKEYVIEVTDNGVGFDEKYLDRIFAVFQRLHGRDQYEGTGIGLAVCRKIVERHNGTITATSTPGSGSKFIVTFPIKATNQEKPHDN